MKPLSLHLIGFALATTFGSSAQAAVFTVGSGPGCTHGTIQSAINAANDSAGPDTVRLTRSLTYEPEANAINTAQELTVEGGYATCDQANPDATNTIISGTGGVHAPVFTITAPTGALIHLRRLTISGGDGDGGSTGGGIHFQGDGILDIANSLITQNTAGYGGGIYVKGTGSHTELVLGANVVVINNTARYSGGGIMAQGVEMSMTDAGNSSILLNKALGTSGTGGFGGGIYVYAADRPSYAYIGSGAPAFGAIYGNEALYGGGVAVLSTGSDAAELQLFATDPAHQAYVGFNSASIQGGGIYVSNAKSAARLWNAVVDNNDAPNGAAAYMASSSGLYVNFAAMHPAATGCVVGADCGRISNNVANADSNPGAIVYGENNTTIQFGYLPTAAPADARGGMLIEGNTAGSVFGGSGTTQIYRSIIGNNNTSSDVIQQSSKPLSVVDSTIAGNVIGGGSAILRTVNSAVTLRRAILWQPGTTVISRSGGTVAVADTFVNENISTAFAAYALNPFLVDPAHGDYNLRAGSKAVDFALALGGNERDAYGQPRSVDLFNPGLDGPRDVGALERQTLQPLVLNGDFDPAGLRLWDVVSAGTTTRDATQDASGAANSGSAHVTRASPANGQETYGISQCIHLPGPATYALNGWGRGTGNGIVLGDKARLRWEYRHNGGDDCSSGAADATGWLDLSGSSTWRRAAQPALIEAAQVDWGDSPSIKVILVAVETPAAVGATNAWFDGITLEILASDVIFADGFD
ncbi:hypothetical protein [Dokdonella sp.]|uniref:hypothetical protein n=1 Tax=Dokdonella sp. TaxID=2291710 RepID=UPI0027BA6278|nr:hypothetical protein [Dokdonella sp.]